MHVPERGTEADEGKDRENVVEDDHPWLNPVTAETGQFPFHGFIQQVDELGQGIFGAATRAAKQYRLSCPFQLQGVMAVFTCGVLLGHAILSVDWGREASRLVTLPA
ncbi:hypothetical protein DSCO28_11680 [Desulfosarcina ovata subsp. sediminis]|uniref:Uncharacterized protein n=1 Tax=Desulfosarcina ovata subsp. sediminis TaxID=885957 RepID=A0A5K7ZEW5_9BACT|nr:hypothetical protein DSCO28_11680 [Desulfosarcina ovata subsp. sediminis]